VYKKVKYIDMHVEISLLEPTVSGELKLWWDLRKGTNGLPSMQVLAVW